MNRLWTSGIQIDHRPHSEHRYACAVPAVTYDQSDLPGFYMAIGTSGNQSKNAPVAGMMMAALIDYVEQGNDHDADPLQYRLPNMDFTLDMRFCSRKREINRESSFSVVG